MNFLENKSPRCKFGYFCHPESPTMKVCVGARDQFLCWLRNFLQYYLGNQVVTITEIKDSDLEAYYMYATIGLSVVIGLLLILLLKCALTKRARPPTVDGTSRAGVAARVAELIAHLADLSGRVQTRIELVKAVMAKKAKNMEQDAEETEKEVDRLKELTAEDGDDSLMNLLEELNDKLQSQDRVFKWGTNLVNEMNKLDALIREILEVAKKRHKELGSNDYEPLSEKMLKDYEKFINESLESMRKQNGTLDKIDKELLKLQNSESEDQIRTLLETIHKLADVIASQKGQPRAKPVEQPPPVKNNDEVWKRLYQDIQANCAMNHAMATKKSGCMSKKSEPPKPFVPDRNRYPGIDIPPVEKANITY